MMAPWSRRRARTGLGLVPISKDRSVGRRTAVRRLAGWLLMGLVLFQVGCYSYLPLQTELPRSPEVKVMLNDRGRVQLGEGMGPFVEAVEGVVAGEDSLAVRLKVSRVVYLRGGTAVWAGEEVAIQRSGIMGYQGRQFSKGRSWALAGLTAAVVIYSIYAISLDVFGDERSDVCRGQGCGPGETVRW